MDNEEIRYEEYSLLPEHDIPPEFTPEYPDVSFFQESYVTAREENIFQGEVPEGETDPKAMRKEKRRQRSRFEWFRSLLGSAMRGGAIAFAIIGLVSTLALGQDSSQTSSPVQKSIADRLTSIKNKKLFLPHEDYGPEELAKLWSGDPEGPHQFDFEHAHVRREASCVEDGILEYYCTECGLALTETVHIDHQPTAAVKENEEAPGCRLDGGYDTVIYCASCHGELSRTHTVLPATGHTTAEPVMENIVGAVCEASGSYDTVVYCSVCGEELSREHFTVDALGHTPGEAVKENEKDPDCTHEGAYDLAVYCQVCGKELSRESVSIPANGHREAFAVKENPKEPSCTAEGSYESVVYCMVCHEELSREKVTLPKTAHIETQDIEENIVEPDCVTEGSYERTVYCDVCGQELSRETVVLEALGHTEDEPLEEERIEATCTTEGSYDLVVYCQVCGEELSREHNVIEMLPHTPAAAVRENQKAATCTAEGGYDDVVYCSVCQTEISRTHQTIAKVAHTPASAVRENVRNATCTAAGSYDEVVYCSVCRTQLSRTQRTIAALGHNYSNTVTAPTCTARGYTTHTCSRCGDSYTDSYTNALGHNWGAPTYTWSSDNSKVTATRTCRNDSSHTQKETVSTTSQVTQAATCSEAGNQRYTSAAFKNSAFSVQTKNVPIATIAHTPGSAQRENYQSATCTEAGGYDLVTYCTVCGALVTKQQYAIAAHGHSFAVGDTSTSRTVLYCSYGCETPAVTIRYNASTNTFTVTADPTFFQQLQQGGYTCRFHVEVMDSSNISHYLFEDELYMSESNTTSIGNGSHHLKEYYDSGTRVSAIVYYTYTSTVAITIFSPTFNFTVP